MGFLLLPSLSKPDHFLRVESISREEALSYIQNFQEQARVKAVADRVAFPDCHISAAPADERALGGEVQILTDIPVDEFTLADLNDESTFEALATVCIPGLSGRRAVYIETDVSDSFTFDPHPLATVIVGTLVTFNERRYTREFWDVALSEHVALIKLGGLTPADQDNAPAGVILDDLAFFPDDRKVNDAIVIEAQISHISSVARELRRLGSGSLFGAPKTPELLALGERLEASVASLSELLPAVPQPEPVTPPAVDVDKVIEQGKVIFKDAVGNAREAIGSADKQLRKARSWLADRLNDTTKR